MNGEYAGTVPAEQFLPSSFCNQNVARFSILYTTTSANHLTLLYLMTLLMYAYLSKGSLLC
jgi:hypothetical protein